MARVVTQGGGGVGGANTPDLSQKGAAAKRPTAPEARGVGETNKNWYRLVALGPAGPLEAELILIRAFFFTAEHRALRLCVHVASQAGHSLGWPPG